ncbi:MAG: GNAT family N-acetyltransferase [Bacillota bacterium]
MPARLAVEQPGDQELLDLYQSVGDRRVRLGDVLVQAVRDSDAVVTARDGERLVGLARGISDGGLTTLFVCDLLVAPPYQGQGTGTALVRRLMDLYPGALQVVLLTDPPTVPFYQRLGFRRWPAAMVMMREV